MEVASAWISSFCNGYEAIFMHNLQTIPPAFFYPSTNYESSDVMILQNSTLLGK